MTDEPDQHAAAHPEEADAGTATVQIPKPATPRQKPKQLPPFKILLHNDDVNTFEHVFRSILKLTALAADEAVVRTLEAHESGVSLLLVTHKERAELYVEQFATMKITVSMEPDQA